MLPSTATELTLKIDFRILFSFNSFSSKEMFRIRISMKLILLMKPYFLNQIQTLWIELLKKIYSNSSKINFSTEPFENAKKKNHNVRIRIGEVVRKSFANNFTLVDKNFFFFYSSFLLTHRKTVVMIFSFSCGWQSE